MKVPSSLAKPSSVSSHPVAQHEAVLRQLVGDREHGGTDAWIAGSQEPHQRHQQQRGIQCVGVVVLHEDALVVHPVRADVGVYLLGGLLPAIGRRVVVADPRQARAAIGRHPAHQLRGREVLRLAPHLPYAPVGLAPVRERLLHLALDDRPEPVGQLIARPRVQVDRIEHRAPHVVLLLVVRAVADAHGTSMVVPGKMLELLLLEPALPPDPVHHLQLPLLGLRDVCDEVEEVVRLLVEAEGVERPQHERRVADPAVAVVPVAVSAGRLRQRGRGGGDQRPGRRVGEALERECAALQVGPPRVIRKRAALQPLLPEAAGRLHPFASLLVGRRQRIVRPAERHERDVPLLQRGACPGPSALEAEAQVGHQPQLEVHALRARHRLVVARLRCRPSRRPARRSRTPARNRA